MLKKLTFIDLKRESCYYNLVNFFASERNGFLMENFTFDKIEYVRPDVDKAEEICKELTARVRAAKSYEEVKQIILESDKSGEEMATMINVAHIRNTLNTTDKFYEDEMAFLHQRLPVAEETVSTTRLVK